MTVFPWINADVLMDDATTYKVEADQRDQRRAMMPTNYGGAGIRDPQADPLGWERAVAWAYLTRTETIDPDTPWPAFDAACRFVQLIPDDDDDDEDGGDDAPRPTSPAPVE